MMPLESILDGIVTSFDEARGTGEITWLRESKDEPVSLGEEVVAFHCASIADGTRHIDTGAPVAFSLASGHYGMPEACRITKL
ncbi:MAG: hypothetical protein ACYDGY_02310 [Acidimicrobiales bacterium]